MDQRTQIFPHVNHFLSEIMAFLLDDLILRKWLKKLDALATQNEWSYSTILTKLKKTKLKKTIR